MAAWCLEVCEPQIISRRLFLIGTTAALAAVAVPITSASQTSVVRAVLDPRFTYRGVLYVEAGFLNPSGSSCPVRLAMRGWSDEEDMFDVTMDVRANYRWRALAGCEMALDDRALMISCEPAVDGVVIQLVSNVERDPGKRPRCFLESFEMRDDPGKRPRCFLESFEILDGLFVVSANGLWMDPLDEEWARRAA